MHLPLNRFQSRSRSPHPVPRMYSRSSARLTRDRFPSLIVRFGFVAHSPDLDQSDAGSEEDRRSGGAYFLHTIPPLSSHPSPRTRLVLLHDLFVHPPIAILTTIHTDGHLASPSRPPRLVVPSSLSRIPSDCAGCSVSAPFCTTYLSTTQIRNSTYHFLYCCSCTPRHSLTSTVQMAIRFPFDALSFVIVFYSHCSALFPIRQAKDRRRLKSIAKHNYSILLPPPIRRSSSSNTLAEIQTMDADPEFPAALLATTPSLRSQ
ncbi:hypothetical protein DFH08DRAFT_997265 [Mycena albidolilacea]|uniref:Uncharacterized protein n=1 Tax=Mycena albidolilacea TaxID=1033008 RepID=A0AAD7ET06_9AGAR|nr:hypothetical protein DFH08DRAFT_997265 [Mycena albidolilacea]